MLSTLATLLGAFDDSRRLYRLQGEGALGSLMVEAWAARESLGSPGAMTLTTLSEDPQVDLDALLGQHATLVTRLASGKDFSHRGVVVAAEHLGADGGLARVRLEVHSWLGLLAHTVRSQVWQERPLLDIVASVFSAYAPLAQWRVADCVADHLAQSPWHDDQGQRSWTTQYRETDLAFITRLLAQEGLVLRIEPDSDTAVILADTVRDDSCPVDSSAAAAGGIRFHRDNPTEQADTVLAFGGQRLLPTHTLAASSSDYKTERVLSAQLPSASAWGSETAPLLEAFDSAGAYAWHSNAGAERALLLAQQAQEAQHKRFIGRGTVRSFTAGQTFELLGSPLDALLALNALGKDAAEQRSFLLTAVHHVGINNLPKELSDALAGLAGLAGLLDGGKQPARAAAKAYDSRQRHQDPYLDAVLPPWVNRALRQQASTNGYANTFSCVRRHVPWRLPLRSMGRLDGLDDGDTDIDTHHLEFGTPLHPKPPAPGFLTATVVGERGQTDGELHCDALGRVRVRFDFQTQTMGPDTSSTSPWLRVAQSWASGSVGAQFLPRIGQQVLVEFLDGDIDRPLVIAGLYDGRGEGGVPATPGGQEGTSDTAVFAKSTDHSPGGQGNLAGGEAGGHSPAWHGASPGALDAGHQRNSAAMSGFKSKEFFGAGYNQLVFDDSNTQLRTQLASTQHTSQLNLGHLIHQADNHRGSFRGLGFELRTDAYGAIRASLGVLLTTASTPPQGPAGDHAPGIALARQLLQVASLFNGAAQTHQTPTLASVQGTKKASYSRHTEGKTTEEAPYAALATAFKGMVAGPALEDAQADAQDRATAAGQGKIPHLVGPVVALQGQAGITTVAGQDQVQAAGQVLAEAAGRDSHQATGGHQRIHTGQAIGLLAGAVQPGSEAQGTGLTLVAGSKRLQIQAQSDKLQIAAKGDVTIQSELEKIDWAAAKKVTIATAGGARITIEGGGITVMCPGTMTVRAGKKNLMGGAKADYPRPDLPQHSIRWPDSTPAVSERLDVYDVFGGIDLARVKYRVKRQDGRFETGALDEAGRAHRMEAADGEPFEYLVGLSGDWGLVGDDGDVRGNDGDLHHPEHDNEDEDGDPDWADGKAGT